MKNFNWLLLFIFSFLPFLASGNVIEVNESSGDKTDYYFDNVDGALISFNNPHTGTSPQIFSFQNEVPLYLVIYDETNDVFIHEEELTGFDYKLEYTSDSECFVYERFFDLSLDARYLGRNCGDIQQDIGVQGLFTIMEKVGGLFQEPQNSYNRELLGLSTDTNTSIIPDCAQYEDVNYPLIVSCLGIANGSPIPDPNNPKAPKRQANSSNQKTNSLIKTISPNPFSDNFEIYFSNKALKHEVEIFNIEGSTIFKQGVYDINKLYLPTEHWEKGIYFVKISSNHNSEIIKIAKF